MWTRLNDGFLRNRKIRTAGRDATMLHLAALLHCAEHLTDGLVLAEELPIIAAQAWTPENAIPGLVTRLVKPPPGHDAGLWVPVPGGYRIHDWDEFNPPAESVHKRRREARERRARAANVAREALHRSRERAANVAETSLYPVPVPVPVPVSLSTQQREDIRPSVYAGTDRNGRAGEVDQVLEILGAKSTRRSRSIVARKIDEHPATDPIDVADLDYVGWQETEQARAASGQSAILVRDSLRGWCRAMDTAAQNGYYGRRTQPALPVDIEIELPPSGSHTWDTVRAELLSGMGPANYAAWIAPLELGDITADTIELRCPNPYHLEWLDRRLRPRIHAAMAAAGIDATISLTTAEDGE